MSASNAYLLIDGVTFVSKVDGQKVYISKEQLLDATIRANNYLQKLSEMFVELNIDIYGVLGQRNLSGFIGEVFSNIIVKVEKNLILNPHADGRPDLLDLNTDVAKIYFEGHCIEEIDARVVPRRSTLAPFKYGGIEVKCSIGSPKTNYKKLLFEKLGTTNFELGIPRIDYLNTITYWGHHQSCENLLGLYYDYYEPAGCVPQILAVMHSELVKDEDWNAVSVGKEGSKKTSNTSLTGEGKKKLFGNTKIVINDKRYLQGLKQVGLIF